MATLGNPKETIAILNKYGFNFQKKFGQNFLIDTHVLEKIIRAADITKDDCVIAVSFPRYSEMDKLALEMAYDAGAKIVLITDKESSPLAQYATQILTVSVDSNAFFNSFVAVVFTLELLCTFISKKMGHSPEAKLELIDKYLSKVGMF